MADEPPVETDYDRFNGTLVPCDDPDCPVAWAFRDPPAEHWHPRPHGPEVPDGS